MLGEGCGPLSGSRYKEKQTMSKSSKFRAICSSLAVLSMMTAGGITASAQTPQKPNILFIMGDDIGWMQPSIYHRGLMVGETPNIDRIGNEGAMYLQYYAE